MQLGAIRSLRIPPFGAALAYLDKNTCQRRDSFVFSGSQDGRCRYRNWWIVPVIRLEEILHSDAIPSVYLVRRH